MVRSRITWAAALVAAALVGFGAPGVAWAASGVRVEVNDAPAPLVSLQQVQQAGDLPDGSLSPHGLLALVPGVVPQRVSRMEVVLPNLGGTAEVPQEAYGDAPASGAPAPASFSASYGTDAVSYDGRSAPLHAPIVVRVTTDGEVLRPVLSVTGQDGGAVTFSIAPGTVQPAHLSVRFGDGAPDAELDATGTATTTHQYAPGSWSATATSYAAGAAGRSDPVAVQVGAPVTASTPAPATAAPGATPGGTGAGGGAGVATGPTTGPQRAPSRRPVGSATPARPTRTRTATTPAGTTPAGTTPASTTPAATTPASTATVPLRTTTAPAPTAATPAPSPATPSPTTPAAAPSPRRDPQPDERPARPAAAPSDAARVSGIVLAGAGASPGDLLAASAVDPEAVRAAARPGDRPHAATSVPTWVVVVACAAGLFGLGAAAEGRRSRRDLLDVGR